MNEFHFLRPWWLLALLPLAWLVHLLRRQASGGGAWQDIVDAALLPSMLEGTAAGASRLPAGLVSLVGGLAILALAGPTFHRLPAPAFRELAALVVVLDLSPAMEAGDLKPSRMERARFKIDDILRTRKDGQSALVVYAGDAFTVTPLTDDAATITAQLTALSPRIMPVPGDRPDLGLARAAKLLNQAGLRGGDVLWVTAGHHLDGMDKAVQRLRSQGYRLSVLGVGTPEGAPIPLGQGGFLKDSRGAIVVPRLDPAALRRLATAGGGIYRELETGSGDVDALLGFLDRPDGGGQETGNLLQVDQWREAGIYLLPLLLPLAALAFRRGWLGAVLILALLPAPRPASAAWQDWWLTPDQQAQRALRAGDAETAAQQFRDPAWRSAADYQAGHYDAAAKGLEALDTAAGHYNRGNALAKAGKLEDALKAYDRALQLAPGDEDTRYNRKLVEDELKRQQEQKQQQQQKDQQQGQGQDQPQQSKSEQGDQNRKENPQSRDGQEQNRQEPQQSPQDGKPQEPSQQAQRPSAEDGKPQDQRQPAEGQEAAKPGSESESAERQAPQPDAGKDQAAEKPAAQAEQERREKAAEPAAEKPASAASEPPAEARDEEAREAIEGEVRDENRQAEEQWLRRIPDDPGGLLRRKFYYQYQQRQQQESERSPW